LKSAVNGPIKTTDPFVFYFELLGGRAGKFRETILLEKENGNDHNKGGSTAPSLCLFVC